MQIFRRGVSGQRRRPRTPAAGVGAAAVVEDGVDLAGFVEARTVQLALNRVAYIRRQRR